MLRSSIFWGDICSGGWNWVAV